MLVRLLSILHYIARPPVLEPSYSHYQAVITIANTLTHLISRYHLSPSDTTASSFIIADQHIDIYLSGFIEGFTTDARF